MNAGAGPNRPASDSAGPDDALSDDAVSDNAASEDLVSGEAGRLAQRLEVALGRLRSSLPTDEDADPVRGSQPQPKSQSRIEGADDEVRHLLTPTLERVTQLTELAHALADDTQSDEATRLAAEAVAATQPFRRPR